MHQMKTDLKKILLSTIGIFLLATFTSCGGGGGGSSSNNATGPIVSNISYAVRVGELDSKNLIVAELTTGRVFIFNRETAESTDLLNLAPFSGSGLGISGLLVDKDFNSNGYVFIYHGTGESGRNVLTRVEIKDKQVIKRLQLQLLTPPSGHNGGGMYQLANGSILLGIGDGDNPTFSANLNKLEGKIINVSRDGQFIKSDNSFPDGIYARGFRNPFGISGKGDKDIFVSDNGPDCDDEINKLIKGGNYGWREGYECGKHLEGETAPIYSWSPSEGLTDLLYVEDHNKLLVSHYNTNTLVALSLDNSHNIIVEEKVIIQNAEEPAIDLLQTKNGEILYSTPTSISSLLASSLL